MHRYYGFIPDLLEALSKRLHFDYELYQVPDGMYGAFDNVTNQWIGMIGEVIRKDVWITFVIIVHTAC